MYVALSVFKSSLNQMRLPNDQDQLPGRLLGHCTLERENAGPVNCIRLFGVA